MLESCNIINTWCTLGIIDTVNAFTRCPKGIYSWSKSRDISQSETFCYLTGRITNLNA
ncbi:Uncharacterised protein [Segatella copri]|nr:Uncharacterised protein [Segatella copri]